MYGRFLQPNKTILLVLILLLSVSSLLWGQLSVVSTTPVDGTAGLDTVVTFTITFNTAIDTSARFPYPGEFFLNILLEPDSLVGEPDTIYVSPDFRTVTVENLHLSENTTYNFVIVDAVSQSNDSLDIPYAFTFSTKASLPTNSVSGVITYGANDPTGTLVILFNRNPFASEGGGAGLGAIVQDNSGVYTVNYLPAGKYWPAAIQEFYIAGDGELEFKTGSALGFYDPNGDKEPDSIEVSEGVPLTDINFSLQAIIPQTARAPLTEMNTVAASWAADAALIAVSGDFGYTGLSTIIQYVYYSAALQMVHYWMTFGTMIISVGEEPISEVFESLPENWLDSDAAMAIAEENGGTEFRQTYSDYESYGMVGSLNFFMNEDNGDRSVSTNTVESKTNLPYTFKKLSDFKVIKDPIFRETLKRDQLPAIWIIQYYSENANYGIQFILNALTGELLSSPQTALVAEAYAKAAVTAGLSDAALFMAWSGEIDSQGKSEYWNFFYYSPLADSLIECFTWGSIPVYIGPLGWLPSDTTLLPDGWLDSDECIGPAESGGGANYRMVNSDVYVSADLGWYYFGQGVPQVVWHFFYNSSSAPPIEFFVDAYTGLITSIENESNTSIPEQYELYQNYPNPFNPFTWITYDLPKMSKVELSVYTTLGQKIVTLVDDIKPAGRYQHQWEPQSLASGLYILMLKTENVTKVRKMYYLR